MNEGSEVMNKTAQLAPAVKGIVYCPICTRYVEGMVIDPARKPRVARGQKCPRCSSAMDAAVVVQVLQAA